MHKMAHKRRVLTCPRVVVADAAGAVHSCGTKVSADDMHRMLFSQTACAETEQETKDDDDDDDDVGRDVGRGTTTTRNATMRTTTRRKRRTPNARKLAAKPTQRSPVGQLDLATHAPEIP